jgi:hypothetical protein
LYLSLFGRDLAAGETTRASCRLILSRHLSTEDAIRHYGKYAQEPADRKE